MLLLIETSLKGNSLKNNSDNTTSLNPKTISTSWL